MINRQLEINKEENIKQENELQETGENPDSDISPYYTEKLELEKKVTEVKPMIALTFDDGPNMITTKSILETLKDNGAVATFFVLGSRAKQNKELILQMAENGNEIGNHTYSHKLLTKLSKDELSNQIKQTQNIINEITGIEPIVMRPTYGEVNDRIKEIIGMPLILWSVDPKDWKTKNAKAVSEHILSRAKDGDIVLMHDIYLSTAEAVKTVIPELIKRGFELVTVSELFREKEASLEVGNVYRYIK